ncbi:hypothetical protein KC359_g8917 [Hortaea werneckii]|nr:hypothetical protein KC359_g8917 [Hortaea werneckii]
MDDTTNEYMIQNAKAFTMRRLVRNGSSIAGVPMVVKCEWTPLKTRNLLTFEGTLKDAQSVKSCEIHPFCKGHLCTSNGSYLIPYGFAVGGEIISSDGSILNQAVITGDKNSDDISDHCYNRIKGKKGILRKSCNGCRPVNSFRLVISPGDLEPGYISIPRRVMDRARFMYVSGDGRCRMRKMRDGMVIMMGRCPSQGADSALPMKIMTADGDVSSVRICPESCIPTNADFDGDEVYMIPPASADSESELNDLWYERWQSKIIKPVFEPAKRIAKKNGLDDSFDPAMLSTMTFEEMSEHPGGEMYDSMILKRKAWKEMYRVAVSRPYWKTCVKRFEEGIVNTISSRHGLAGPYGFMRMGMMLGTCVNMRDDTLVIDSPNVPQLPLLNVPTQRNLIPCSSAITKLTKVMYQSGIDTSKHGAFKGKIPAISTLMDDNGYAYAIKDRGEYPTVALMNSSEVYMHADLYTNLQSILKANTPQNKLEYACMIVGMIEEIDSVLLTDVERIACAFLFSFLSFNVTSLMGMKTIDLMTRLGLDWYTSATCSDVRWIRKVIREKNVSLSTDISSVLGSIFIGNMSLYSSRILNPMKPGRTVASTQGYSSRLCTSCTNTFPKWNECVDFLMYKDEKSLPDIEPSEGDWVKSHGAVEPSQMNIGIIAMKCPTCKKTNKKKMPTPQLVESVERITLPLAGIFTLMIGNQDKIVSKWTKTIYQPIPESVATDTETETEDETDDE